MIGVRRGCLKICSQDHGISIGFLPQCVLHRSPYQTAAPADTLMARKIKVPSGAGNEEIFPVLRGEPHTRIDMWQRKAQNALDLDRFSEEARLDIALGASVLSQSSSSIYSTRYYEINKRPYSKALKIKNPFRLDRVHRCVVYTLSALSYIT
jgi:hypothetical protein